MYLLGTQPESLHTTAGDVTAVSATRFAAHEQRAVVEAATDHKSRTAATPKDVGRHTTTDAAHAATEALVG
ncbi:hypothetical protein B4U45_00350 [Mycobacterium persicum]|uniref:Uncharacterized protein n=1 Tax=Mycobacterium persicum TaxID=1487726 RepID=A0A1X0L325_9MYCO|nr:hypothetical protein [Mycobacterium persicum]KZS84607.1 hypothetical protein A4G31_00635 [Mycobacterium persicum]ORB87999.1 hypothetical protein B1T49_00340 [Mycobacterium persicum]ORB93280.1 hypothetical protein B1T44_00350 [Mycobacterium persicum]ORC00032.1 hypothetical protein B1T48_00190 [Mycobacterium persicum]ORC05360.1 hypothetical protein B4U45_00350 [Mycobacterium persicum]